jgi:xylan 1,4-beta-xylosidase
MRAVSRAVAGIAAAACLLVLAAPAAGQIPLLEPQKPPSPPPAPAPTGHLYTNPVIPGDYPDPSVIRDGRNYWLVTTSGGWRPAFTMQHSRDLVNWDVAGSVLRHRPAWAEGQFWAPELVRRGDRFLVYYAAKSRKGRFCVAVASARSPAGFFRDHGPLVCSPEGSIDPLAVEDEKGVPHLVWKDDGNARRRPTPIMAAPLAPDGLRVLGTPRELFRGDAPWEGGLVEAPALVRRGSLFYMLYSARSCCGQRCDYALGVARAPTLLGPWQKHSEPILSGTERFRCPGHASVVDTAAGEQYLLYHAYTESGSIDVGRQVLLDRLGWSDSGWPVVNGGRGPTREAPTPGGVPQVARPDPFADEFRGRFLTAGWYWTSARPRMRMSRRDGGRLLLGTSRGRRTGIVGRQPGGTTFVAETALGNRRRGTDAGIAVYAEDNQAIGIEVRGDHAVVWRRPDARRPGLAALHIGRRRSVALRVRALGVRRFAFDVGTETGWHRVGDVYPPPAWRGEQRVVLRVSGPRRARAAFERFELGPVPGERR